MKLLDKIFKLILHYFFFKNKVSIFSISKRILKTTDFTILSSQSVFEPDLTKINTDQNSQFKPFLSPTILPFSYFFICKEAMIYESHVKDYKNNEYLVESLRNFPSDFFETWLKTNLMDFLKLSFKKTNIIIPNYNYIYLKNFSNYFHFIFDNLIPLSKIITKNPDEKYKFLIFRPLNKWQKEYYKLIGLNLNDFIICKEKSLVKNLIVYTSSRQRFSYSNELLNSFKKQILNNFKSKFSDDSNKKIYISRSDSKKRVLQNEKKVIDVLKKIGFKILVLTDLKLENQIKYFFNAKIIVAPHGAGLSNIIYSTNFKLIEIVDNNFQKAHFMNLSIQLGGFYHSVCTEIIENKRVVNINKLLKSINHE